MITNKNKTLETKNIVTYVVDLNDFLQNVKI